MQVRVHDSIDTIGSAAVEATQGGIDFSFGVLRAMERTLWGHLTARYLTVEDDGGQVLAFTPVYLGSNLNFIALLPKAVQKGYTALVGALGSMIATRAAVVGSLISDRGWIPIRPDCADRAGCLRLMIDGIDRLARQNKVQLIMLKDIHSDFPAEERATMRSAGYMEGYSLPTMRVNTDYRSFEEYLMLELSKNGRKHARKQFHKAEGLYTIRVYSDFEEQIERVFHLHRAVFLQAKYQFEELPPQFFAECNRSTSPESELVVCERSDGRVVGSLLIFYNSREQQNKRIGIDYGIADSGLIYNLLNYTGIQRAIERGLKSLLLGQSSYLVKARLGGRIQDQYLMLKPLDPALKPTMPLQRLWMERYSAARVQAAIEQGIAV